MTRVLRDCYAATACVVHTDELVTPLARIAPKLRGFSIGCSAPLAKGETYDMTFRMPAWPRGS